MSDAEKKRTDDNDNGDALPPSSFMAGPAGIDITQLAAKGQVSERIGRYKLLEQIGEGGFGVVFMADQLEPIQRRVALKIVKAGMDTKQVIARFEAERQSLALMDHPHIAKVFDAGETDHGRPYFVMELVRGVPVTDYCDEQNTSTVQRLRLFVEICGAVQHAHQKGIIHRDIKPSNVLVYSDGVRPVPKIIDFGIAKATQGRLTDKTLFTQFRQFIGTPTYMSPEQALMSGVDIDTRSDIYSLGVLLYELMTGKTPLDSSELANAGYEEICRRIREEEAIVPSRRISSFQAEELKTVAKSRQVDPGSFPALIRGDLDWIAMKAVEKDRSRRYASADAMAKDVQRYLDGEPVSAVPPSAIYLLKKFVRRNRRVLLALGMIAGTLLVATIVSSWFAIANGRLNSKLAGEIVAKGAAVERAQLAQGELSEQLATTEAARAEAELGVYVLAMNRAYQAYEDADLTLARLILEDYRDSKGGTFEWRCLEWLCETGDALHTLAEHSASVRSLDISKNGILASCADNGTCLLHDLQTRISVGELKHACAIRHMKFSPDGTTLAVADERGQLMEWQVHPCRMLRTLGDNDGEVINIAFSFDGTLLSVWRRGADQLEIWDWRESQLALSLPLHGRVYDLDFSPAGNQLAAAADGPGIRIWDTSSPDGELWGVVLKAHTSFTMNVAFSRPDGQYLATSAFLEGAIKVWNVAATRGIDWKSDFPEAYSTLQSHRGTVLDLEYSPDGSYLGSAGDDQTIRLWPGRSPKGSVEEPLVTLRGHKGAVNGIAFSHDGEMLVSGSADQTIKIWPGRTTSDANVLLGHNDWVFDVAFSPNGKLLASGAFDGEVCLWDTTTQERLFGKKLHDHEVFRVTFSPDGRTVASCDGIWQMGKWSGLDSSHPGSVQLLDVKTQTHKSFRLPNNAGVRTIDFSPDGKSLAIGDYEGRLWLLDVEEKEIRDSVQVGSGMINGLQYSPDGSLIATSMNDFRTGVRQLACYGANDLQQKSHLAGRSAWRLAFAPPSVGPYALAVPSERGIEFFNVQNGFENRKQWDSYNMSGEVAYSPDGKTLATGGAGHVVRLWNVESGGEVAKLSGHTDAVTSIAFSPDGSMLASSGEDQTIRIWRTMPVTASRPTH